LIVLSFSSRVVSRGGVVSSYSRGTSSSHGEDVKIFFIFLTSDEQQQQQPVPSVLTELRQTASQF